jgi:hypothetical protein
MWFSVIDLNFVNLYHLVKKYMLYPRSFIGNVKPFPKTFTNYDKTSDIINKISILILWKLQSNLLTLMLIRLVLWIGVEWRKCDWFNINILNKSHY